MADIPQKPRYGSRSNRRKVRRRIVFGICVLIAGGVFGLVVSVVMPSLRSKAPERRKISVDVTNRTSESLSASVDADDGRHFELARIRAGESSHVLLDTGGIFYFDQPAMRARITIVQLGGTAAVAVTADTVTAVCTDQFGKTRTIAQPTVSKQMPR